ncbi:MAG: hypothetical protein K8S98_15020 [Planctomycetes bacterium]|nr:hypothetical protein [Planctomycetota bacterium]
MQTRLRFAVLFASAVSFLAVRSGAQSTWHVDVNGTAPGTGTSSDPFTSIQFAISRPATVDQDIVLVHPGTYVELIDFVGKSLTVGSSDGEAVTILDGGGQGSVVSVKSGENLFTTLAGFTIRNGAGTFDAPFNVSRGGGVYCVGSFLRMQDCTVIDNATLLPSTTTVRGSGGGVYAKNATVTIIDCTLESNEATEGGGAWFEQSNAAIFFSEVRANVAHADSSPSPSFAGKAGGIGSIDSDVNFDSGLIASNVAESTQFLPARGGGMLSWNGTGSVLNALIEDNSAGVLSLGDFQGQGGGVEVLFTPSFNEVFLANCEIRGNRATQGAGVLGLATLSDVSLHDNVGQIGAGVYSFGSFIHQCDVFDNAPVDSSVQVTGLGVFNEPTSTTTIEASKIHGHHGIGFGIGVHGGELTACRLYDNHGVGPFPSEGGGAYGATLASCFVYDNEVSETGSPTPNAVGGGLRSCTAQRCFVYDNVANAGGGAHDSSLDHCSFENNSGGGLFGGSAVNSILWNNHPVDVAGGATVTWSDVGTGASGVGNLALDPQFWMAAFNDYYLRPNSPCIDAGDPASPHDPNGSIADMGAVPFDFTHYVGAVVYCTAKVNSLGCTPAIATVGPPSLGVGTFKITAANVLNKKSGILFWGSKSSGTAFQGGHLCVKPPLIRTAVQSSGGSTSGTNCTGSYSFTWSHPYNTAHGIVVGQRIFAQFWSRDVASPSGTGLTNAVDFTFIP